MTLTQSGAVVVVIAIVAAITVALLMAPATLARFDQYGGVTEPYAPYTAGPVVAEEPYAPYEAGPVIHTSDLLYAPYTAGPVVAEEPYAPYDAGPVIHESDRTFAPYTEPERLPLQYERIR